MFWSGNTEIFGNVVILIDKVIISLVSPLGTSLFLGVLALIFGARGRRRIAMFLGAVSCVWLLFWSLPVSSSKVRLALESAWADVAPENVEGGGAIVVLGGGIRPMRPGSLGPDLTEAADRLWYSAQLFHAVKAPLLLLSGGGDDDSVPEESEAEAMADFLEDLQVPRASMVLEAQSRNTRQNATFSAKLLREQGVDTIILVTSALHMSRALSLFQAEGLRVIPAPTDFEARYPSSAPAFLPDSAALNASGKVIKEIIGKAVGY